MRERANVVKGGEEGLAEFLLAGNGEDEYIDASGENRQHVVDVEPRVCVI